VRGDGTGSSWAIKENTYDALILDLGLPDVSGLDVLEEIRQIPPDRPAGVGLYGEGPQ